MIYNSQIAAVWFYGVYYVNFRSWYRDETMILYVRFTRTSTKPIYPEFIGGVCRMGKGRINLVWGQIHSMQEKTAFSSIRFGGGLCSQHAFLVFLLSFSPWSYFDKCKLSVISTITRCCSGWNVNSLYTYLYLFHLPPRHLVWHNLRRVTMPPILLFETNEWNQKHTWAH